MPQKRITITGKHAKATYDELHKAWRAGLIDDFRYGHRSDTDPTMIWTLDGVEYAKDAHAELSAALDRVFARAGIASVEWSDPWVGYRALTITRVDGSQSTERYDHDGVGIVNVRTVAAAS